MPFFRAFPVNMPLTSGECNFSCLPNPHLSIQISAQFFESWELAWDSYWEMKNHPILMINWLLRAKFFNQIAFIAPITYRHIKKAEGKPVAAHMIDSFLQSRTPYARPANITSAKVHEYHSDVPATWRWRFPTYSVSSTYSPMAPPPEERWQKRKKNTARCKTFG